MDVDLPEEASKNLKAQNDTDSSDESQSSISDSEYTLKKISSDKLPTKFKGFLFDDYKIYFLAKNDYISLNGSFSLTLIDGNVFIDGISLLINSTFNFHIEKCRGLTIIPGEKIIQESEIIKHIKLYKIQYKPAFDVFAIIKVVNYENYFSRLMYSFGLQTTHKNSSNNSLNSTTKNESETSKPLFNFKCFTTQINPTIYKNWIDTCDNITTNIYKIIFICGPKLVGKSSFSRLLTNISLTSGRRVFLIDTDVDQSMFNNPLQISLYEIKEFLYGWDYSKPVSPLYSIYFGDYSPMFQPIRFINSIKFLINIFYFLSYKSSKDILIINSIGWLKDCGVGILTDMIRYCQPDAIVHINQNDQEFFYQENLSQGIDTSMENLKYINFESEFSEKKASEVIKKLFPKFSNFFHDKNIDINDIPILDFKIKHSDFKVFNIQPCVIQSDQINILELTAANDMCLLSYLYKCKSLLSQKMTTNYIQTLIPIKFKISDIVFSFFGKDVDSEYFVHAFHANIVGFLIDCELLNVKKIKSSEGYEINITNHSEFSECLGLGFIRNIDWKNGDIYLVTPIGKDEIQQMNILAIGNLQLSGRFLKQKQDFSLINSDFCRN